MTAQRVAVISGASRGIGRAIATMLGEQGYAVVVGYAARRAQADEVVDAIAASGGRGLAAQADVADEAAVARMFDTAEAEFGGVDVVVNAAGRMYLAPVAELDLDQLDAMHRTNIRGTFVMAREAARRVRPGGAIVNFSTTQVVLQFPTYGAYAASKGAVEAMTLSLARDLRGRDVTANAVAPGATATDMFLDGKSEELVERLSLQAPLERLGQPEDIAALVAFLASPAGHWVNGQVIRANGGMG